MVIQKRTANNDNNIHNFSRPILPNRYYIRVSKKIQVIK
jgi:hypothetical protein